MHRDPTDPKDRYLSELEAELALHRQNTERLAKLERLFTDVNPSVAIYHRYGHIAIEDDCMVELGRGPTLSAAIDAIEEEQNGE